MYPKSFQKLIDHFSSLPSIGPKLAERLVLFLFRQDENKLSDFASALSSLKAEIKFCKRCFNLSDQEYCHICRDAKRNQKTICVVEDVLDVIAIEKTRLFAGLYHVLGGVISVQDIENQKDLKIKDLEKRVAAEKPEEILLATNPTTEGDATAFYVRRYLKNYPVKITRLARGLSTGSDLEYADEITLSEALTNRKELV